MALVLVLIFVPSVSHFVSMVFFTREPYARLAPLYQECGNGVSADWPKASFHRSLGQRPRNGSTTRCMAEGHIHAWEPMPQVSLAFSQTCSMASISWGVAPGYGDFGLRPTAGCNRFTVKRCEIHANWPIRGTDFATTNRFRPARLSPTHL